MPFQLSSLKNVAFGTDPRTRVGLMRSALAAAFYAACIVGQWEYVRLDLTDRQDAEWVTALCVVGVTFFLFAIRSGFSFRFADAALTMPQMVFAIVCLAVSYHTNPAGRASLALLVPLVLVFGAFILPARRCVQLGWFAVIVFGVSIEYGVWSQPATFPPFAEAQTFAFIALVIPAIAYLAGQLSQLRINQKVQRTQLRDAMERLQRMATHDPLTDLPNRRHVDERMADVIDDARRRELPLCVAIIDLDRFKRVNDEFGHAAGDDVLRLFAREASKLLRDADLLVRWGGEEFLLVLPETNLGDARAIVERMRTCVAASADWLTCPHAPVTFSAGLTRIGDDQTLRQALQVADAALYVAKNQGRDRAVVADDAGGDKTGRRGEKLARRFMAAWSNIA